jgi:hypothetical protein
VHVTWIECRDREHVLRRQRAHTSHITHHSSIQRMHVTHHTYTHHTSHVIWHSCSEGRRKEEGGPTYFLGLQRVRESLSLSASAGT